MGAIRCRVCGTYAVQSWLLHFCLRVQWVFTSVLPTRMLPGVALSSLRCTSVMRFDCMRGDGEGWPVQHACTQVHHLRTARTRGDAAERKYKLSNMNFSLDVISISDGIYDSMVDQMLASGRPIEVPFKNYFSYVNTNTTGLDDMVLFNVASQSIDRLWCTSRAQTYTGMAVAPIPLANAADLFHRELATVPAFTFTNAGTTGLQFQINNTLYPNWQLGTAQELYQHTKLAVGDQGNMLSGGPPTVTAYTDNYFVFAVSLEHHTDSDERFLSGIDTRGSAANCYLKSTGGGGAHQALIFAECTSSLKIMANKVLEIVQ